MIDLGFLTLDGEPRTSVYPAQLISDAEMTRWQRTEVEAGYRRFCAKARTSLAWQQMAHLTLTDGTLIRYERRGLVDRILVNPAQASDDAVIQAPIAWPAFVNLAYAPIFDRTVVNLEGDDYPKYPDLPDEPTYPTLAAVPTGGYGVAAYVITTYDLARSGYVLSIAYKTYIYKAWLNSNAAAGTKADYTYTEQGIPSADSIVATFTGSSNAINNLKATAADGSVSYYQGGVDSASIIDQPSYQIALATDSYGGKSYNPSTGVETRAAQQADASAISYTPYKTAISDFLALAKTQGGIVDPAAVTAAGAACQPYLPVQFLWNLTTSSSSTTARVDMACAHQYASLADGFAAEVAAVEDSNQALIDAWQVKHDAWQEQVNALLATYEQEVSDYLANNVQESAIDYLAPLRVSPRNTQIEAVKTWLDLGISSSTLHLNRRYLSFPFNIKCKHAYTMAQGGTATAGDFYDVTPDGKAVDYTYADATYSVALGTGFMGYDPQETGHRVGGNLDVTLPKNLYGWLVNGTYTHEMIYATHGYENGHVKNLANLSFSRTSDYDKQLASAISPDAATDLVIDSDAYVPAGTVVVLVQLEYEAWDKFTQQWLWTPCVSLFDFDAVWISSLGLYDLGSVVDTSMQGTSPRKVRVRRVLTQSRNSDLSWTAPTDFPSDSLNPAGFAAHEFTDTWSEYPASIVLVRKLAKEAAPLPVGSTTFSHNETAVFTTMGTESFKTLLSSSWANNQTLTKLTADCLKYVYKVS